MDNNSLVSRLENEYGENFKIFYKAIESYIINNDRNNPDFTDHGVLHVKNVMDNADILLKNECFHLNEKDIYYLCLSICIHDLAMGNYDIIRDGHNKKIREVFKEIESKNEFFRGIILDEDVDIICKIAAAHSGEVKGAYNTLLNDKRYSGKGQNEPNMLSLAMLLRISDELDITQRRTRKYPLDAVIKSKKNESQLHWLKHEAIVNWRILEEDQSCIILYLKQDILDKLIPELKLDITKEDFVEFMYEALSKLRYEMKVIREYCDRLGTGMPWKLDKLNLLPSEDISTKNSDYIQILNEKLANNDDTKEEKGRPIYAIEEDIRSLQNAKEVTVPKIKDIKGKYTIIGDDEYRTTLNKYIKDNSMLKMGCFKHRGKRVLNWLDSFAFHQDSNLLLKSSNIFANEIKKQNIDFIIGLGLKGAKIASIVGIKIKKPVFFYMNENIKFYDYFDEHTQKDYNIVMITDCVITGETALSCKKKVEETIKIKNVCLYSVFIRNSLSELQSYEQILEKGISLSTINDMYSYSICQYNDTPEKCPIYILHDKNEKIIYDRHNRRMGRNRIIDNN